MKPAQKNSLRQFQLLHRARPQSDPAEMLELLFALDRSVVEVSMQLYNVDRSDRRTMRVQNRRLHDAVRTHFPRLLKVARTKTSRANR